MELASVRIFVTDVPAAVKFYTDVVGLRRVWGDADVAIFGDDPVIVVEGSGRHGDDEGLVGRFTGITFATDDADSLHAKLTRAGVPTHGAPERQPWGGIFVHADDPSGNTITFLQRPMQSSAEGSS
jgi:catechol 2,3-dioxygenase-like lactoylglutathione lyase family enzyme